MKNIMSIRLCEIFIVALLFVFIFVSLPMKPETYERIAFVSDRDGNYEIYVMDSDGKNQRNISNNLSHDSEPCWSPDGTQIAFASDRDGNYEIYVMDSDGKNQRNISNNPSNDSEPCWSPDGTQIAFASDRDGILGLQIYVMNADGSNQVSIVAPHLDSEHDWGSRPSWSPDGTQILLESFVHANPEIFVIDVDGSNRKNLTNDPAGDGLPRLSPDGTRIAFYSERDFSPEIYVMNADGSDVRRLTRSTFSSWPTWAPDSTRIAFQSIMDGNSEIYIMNADGSDIRRLTSNPAFDGLPSWSVLLLPQRVEFLSAAGVPTLEIIVLAIFVSTFLILRRRKTRA